MALAKELTPIFARILPVRCLTAKRFLLPSYIYRWTGR